MSSKILARRPAPGAAERRAISRLSNTPLRCEPGSAATTPAPEVEPGKPERKKEKEDDDRKHPLIDGLLKELPEPQSEVWRSDYARVEGNSSCGVTQSESGTKVNSVPQRAHWAK